MIIDNVKKRINGLLELSDKSVDEHLYSDAATNLRVAIQFLKTKWKVLQNVEHRSFHFCTVLYTYLMWLEDRRCNFEAVMEVYNDMKDNFLFQGKKVGKDWLEKDEIGNDWTKDVAMDIQIIQSYYELALVNTKDINRDTSCICKFILRQMRAASVDDIHIGLLEMTENVLRVVKKFDEVIALDKKLLLLPNLPESLGVKVSLAVSYIERYREEYHLRSKRNDYFLFKKLLDHIRGTYEYHNDICKLLRFELALAQWHYLCHKLKEDEKQKRICYEVSIRHIEEIVENVWEFKDCCSTCAQAPTKDDVKYVCSGCRVVCYCSIDHQRMNWRKNQVPGTCVGHQIFCPVLNAYRKWKIASNESTIDEEKQGRMRRRFERECLDCLVYGLRLEKKCFEPEDVHTE